MKKLIISIVFSLFSFNSYGFEIYALGTSNINCKGADQAFTKKLNQLFINENLKINVINGGVDGDKPQFMKNRLDQQLISYPNTKIVIFEPGPNEVNIKINLDSSKKILDFLKSKDIPVIYVSNRAIQSPEDAKNFAEEGGAYFYGNYAKGMKPTPEYCQLDNQAGKGCGHLTVQGCELWANQMLSLIKQVIKEKNIQ
jgi:hypothetical protein